MHDSNKPDDFIGDIVGIIIIIVAVVVVSLVFAFLGDMFQRYGLFENYYM